MKRPDVAYRCKNCDKFDHNSRKYQSKEDNPNALKKGIESCFLSIILIYKCLCLTKMFGISLYA